MDNVEILRLINKIRNLDIDNRVVEEVKSLFFSFPQIDLIRIDLILVLGGISINRMQTAVDLYKMKKVPIIISGGTVRKSGLTEHEIYYKYAVSHGVDEEDLLIEPDSYNTYDNIYNSFKMLINNHNRLNILIVSSPQHLFRVSKTVEKVSKELNFFPNCFYYGVYNYKINERNWYSTKKGRRLVADELEKIINYF